MSDKLHEIHEKAIRDFDTIYASQKDERQQARDDRRFCVKAGAQWEGPLAERYENKAKFESNKVFRACQKIINEYLNTKSSAYFVPKKKSRAKLVDQVMGLMRADERDSDAQESFDNAFKEAVHGGYGAWRLTTEYEDDGDEDNDHQRIVYEPIYDAESSVFFDQSSKRQDKRDAKFCYVISSMSPSDYEEEWGEDPSSWQKTLGSDQYDWVAQDVVYIAEYYVKEEKKETIRTFETLTGEKEKYTEKDFEDDEELEDFLTATGAVELEPRKVKKTKIRKYIMGGSRVLEDCGYIAGENLPVVMMYGIREIIEGLEVVMGHVRLAKDLQRLKNMQLSKLGEIAAMSPVEKPILTPEQVKGHGRAWSDDNIKNYPYLLINPMKGPDGETINSGPVSYTKPSSIPPSMAALLQITDDDIREILGTSQIGEDIGDNISGKAVELINSRLDMDTYIYSSQMAKAKRRCAEIYLSMAKDIYVEGGREMKIITDDGDTDYIELNTPTIGEDGEMVEDNNLSDADFDVDIEMGPSSSSAKAATVRLMTNILGVTQDPETRSVLEAQIMMNMEGEGTGDTNAYFRKKLVKMGVIPPSEDEQAEMQAIAAQEDANTTYLKAAAQEAEANAAEARANTFVKIADAKLKESESKKKDAETMEILADLQRPRVDAAPAPAPSAPDRSEYEQAKLLIEAKKMRGEQDIKERELELKEQDQVIRLAEASISARGNEQAEAKVREAKDAISSKMLSAVDALEKTLSDQVKTQKQAVDELGKPKKVVRENGRIVGIE